LIAEAARTQKEDDAQNEHLSTPLQEVESNSKGLNDGDSLSILPIEHDLNPLPNQAAFKTPKKPSRNVKHTNVRDTEDSSDDEDSSSSVDGDSPSVVQGEHDHPLPDPTVFTAPKKAPARGSHTNVGDMDDFALQDTSQLDDDDAFLYSPLQRVNCSVVGNPLSQDLSSFSLNDDEIVLFNSATSGLDLSTSTNDKSENNVVFGDFLSQDGSPPSFTSIVSSSYEYPMTPKARSNSEMTITLYTPNNVYQRFLTGSGAISIKPRKLFETSPNELESFEDRSVVSSSTDDSSLFSDSQYQSPIPSSSPSVEEESQSTIHDLTLSPNSSPSIERLPERKKHSAKIVLYDVHLTDEMIPPTSEYEQVVHVGLSDLFSAENLSEADPYYFERAEELLLSTFEIVTRDASQVEIDLGYLGAKHAEPMKEFIKFYYKNAIIIEAKSFPDTPSTPLASQASRPSESPINYSPSGFDTPTELPPLPRHFQSLPQPTGLTTPIKLSATPHKKMGSVPPGSPSTSDTSINYSPNGFGDSPIQYSPSGFDTPPNLKSLVPPLSHSSQSLSQPSGLATPISLISTLHGKAGNTTLLNTSQSSIVYSPNGCGSPVRYSPSGFESPVKYSPSGFGSPIQYSPSGFALQVVPIKSPATSPLRDTTSHFQVQISPHKNLQQKDQPPQIASTAPPKKSFFKRFFGF
ncbi:MAG: hypothetical protein JNJ47_03250, partial [Alphaproteobacteria bacterium]|nr:hypothetical protein [Alphaproteobacteria bacterium]